MKRNYLQRIKKLIKLSEFPHSVGHASFISNIMYLVMTPWLLCVCIKWWLLFAWKHMNLLHHPILYSWYRGSLHLTDSWVLSCYHVYMHIIHPSLSSAKIDVTMMIQAFMWLVTSVPSAIISNTIIIIFPSLQIPHISPLALFQLIDKACINVCLYSQAYFVKQFYH